MWPHSLKWKNPWNYVIASSTGFPCLSFFSIYFTFRSSKVRWRSPSRNIHARISVTVHKLEWHNRVTPYSSFQNCFRLTNVEQQHLQVFVITWKWDMQLNNGDQPACSARFVVSHIRPFKSRNRVGIEIQTVVYLCFSASWYAGA